MDAIRKKIGQRQGQAVQPVRGVEAGWRLAFGRAVRDAMGLDLRFTALRLQGLSLAELLELPPERALIVMLEGPEGGLGLMLLSPGLMAGLIEMQTFGRLMATPPLVRRPTRTDAAMVAGLLDKALAGLAQTLVTEPERVWTDGFRTTSFIEDPRPLGLLLEDVSYNVLSGHVLMGGGERAGDIILALPANGCGRQAEGQRPVSGEDEPGKGFLFRAALTEQVSQAEATLVAVIGRVRMPLQQVLALRVGDPVPLGAAAIDRVDLEGLDGVRLAGGKLGQNKGNRAVRLNAAAMPATRETVRATSSVAGPMAETAALRPTGSCP